MDHWKMNLLLGYVGFREGNTTRHFLRSTSARALGTRQAKSFCVELPVQLHGRLYDLGQHCPHRTNVEWPSGEVHFANFCFCSLWNLLFQMQKKSRLTNQPPVGAKPDPTNRVDHRTREWSFQRIPVWTPRLGVKPREPRGGMGDVFFCHDPTEKIRISCEMTRFIRFEFWKKGGYNSIQFYILSLFFWVTKIITNLHSQS